MRITDALRGEHAAMRPLLRLIRSDTDTSPGPGRQHVMSHARSLMAIVRAHTTVEESHLYAPLRDAGLHVPDMAVVMSACAKHRTVRSLLERSARTGDKGALNRAVKTLLAHFDEEEGSVFPLAEKALTARAQAGLGAGWASERGIRF